MMTMMTMLGRGVRGRAEVGRVPLLLGPRPHHPATRRKLRNYLG